jgi:hypothetical protein
MLSQTHLSGKSGGAIFPDGDPVRSQIVTRAAALGLTYADLSRAVQRNETYVHQFVFRGTPKRLPEDVRETLARTLGVSEDELRGTPPGQQRRLSPATRAAVMSPPATPATKERDLPVFTEAGATLASAAVSWTPRPRSLDAAPGSFAVWVSRKHGRLNPGDMVFVHPSQPPRDGDLVVVIKDDRIVAVGDLTRQAGDLVSILVTADGKPERFSLGDTRVLKVASIQLP